tara:strand:- start:1118 stop:1450 length:333 start_codon:yes stop_codon:yes gene_type:complete
MHENCKLCGRPILKSKELCRECFDETLAQMQAYAKKLELQERARKVKLEEEKIETIHNAGSSFVEVDKFEEIPRTCLKCDRAFLAKGKFNRICLKCKPKAFKQPWEQDGA